jgi:beta-galactosidase GanA
MEIDIEVDIKYTKKGYNLIQEKSRLFGVDPREMKEATDFDVANMIYNNDGDPMNIRQIFGIIDKWHVKKAVILNYEWEENIESN